MKVCELRREFECDGKRWYMRVGEEWVSRQRVGGS